MQILIPVAMKNKLFSLSAAILGLAVAFVIGATPANAQQVVNPTTCPSATSYYSNGYSVNSCVPSYYPGYPQTTVYVGGSPYNTGGYNAAPGFNNGNGYSTTQYNPFTPPIVNNNAMNLFAPNQIMTAPTWYYPQVQPTGYSYTNYPVGGYGGSAFYNGGYNNYYGGYGYNNGGFGNGYYYGNNGWR